MKLLQRFLIEPQATVLAISAALSVSAIRVGALVTTLGALNAIPSAAKYVGPVTAQLTATVIALEVLGGVLSILAGNGRSPIPSIDNPQPPAPVAPTTLVLADHATIEQPPQQKAA